MGFGILGALQVRDSTDQPVAVPRRKVRALLGVLLCRRNQAIAASTLMDWLWADDRPPSAKANLQNHVSELRRVLRAAGHGGCLHTTATGYLLQVAEGQLDADVFCQLATAGRRALDRADAALAVERLTTAMGLWRGTPLSGSSVPAVLLPELEPLANRRLEVVTDCATARLALGQHHQLVVELPGHLREHPTHQPLWCVLMLAHHRCGQRRAALGVYHRLAAELRHAGTAQPGTAAVTLYRQIVRDDPALASTAPAGSWGGMVIRQLPAAPGRFVGRHTAVATLDRMLPVPDGASGHRPAAERSAGDVSRRAPDAGGGLPSDRTAASVAIVGGPGVGKTALALHWAHRIASRFPDGQLYADLGGYARTPPVDPRIVIARLLRDLAVPGRVPEDVDGAAARYRSALAERRVLIVLDNAQCAEQVRHLLPGGPGCLALITSRDSLDGLVVVQGTQRLRLGTLTPVEARALLHGMLPTGQVVDANTVETLMRRCGHLPLALRIAGAALGDGRSPAVNPLNLATVDGTVSIRGCFDASYQRLPIEDRAVFGALGQTPPDRITVAGVAATVGLPQPATLAALNRLTGANLVDQIDHERYRMPPLLHAYAREAAGAPAVPPSRRR